MVWMKEHVYAALGLHEDGLFEDLLQREGNWAKRELLDYLDQPAPQYSPAVLFYPLEGEVEIEEEVVEGIKTQARGRTLCRKSCSVYRYSIDTT